MSFNGLIDTHVHFDGLGLEDFLPVFKSAYENGVYKIIAVGSAPEANRLALKLANAYPNKVRATAGYDRNQAECQYSLTELSKLLARPETVAVGEVGLDFHYNRQTRKEQLTLFQEMLDMAVTHHLPVIVHSREAETDTITLLRNHTSASTLSVKNPGVLHSFTGTEKFAHELLDIGFMIGSSGILTFRNAGALREVAKKIPDDKLLIETDSPYLAPEPYRGMPNQPAFLKYIAKVMADIRHESLEKITALTTYNAEKLFKREANE